MGIIPRFLNTIAWLRWRAIVINESINTFLYGAKASWYCCYEIRVYSGMLYDEGSILALGRDIEEALEDAGNTLEIMIADMPSPLQVTFMLHDHNQEECSLCNRMQAR